MERYQVRKAFHLLAFLLFVPPIITSKFERPRFIVFAFNCVSVALIYLEILRWSGGLAESTSKWFKSFCSDRERLPSTIIITHIYLLMGCAFPVCATYILVNGGIFAPEWTLWSLSGVTFLGIGDSCVSPIIHFSNKIL